MAGVAGRIAQPHEGQYHDQHFHHFIGAGNPFIKQGLPHHMATHQQGHGQNAATDNDALNHPQGAIQPGKYEKKGINHHGNAYKHDDEKQPPDSGT